MSRITRIAVALFVMLLMTDGVRVQAASDTIEVNVGESITRTWEQVKADNYACRPKQEYNDSTKETHIWLPYGKDGTYHEVVGLQFTGPGPKGTPLVNSTDGNTSGKLVFKFHFDRPISAFRFKAGWSEWGVGAGAVGGVEYSTDGSTWITIREITEGGIVEPFIDGKQKFEGLDTQDLYIRCYSRDKSDPDASFGPGRWMKFRMAGDPTWGDASSTFFNSQMQLWVTAAE